MGSLQISLRMAAQHRFNEIHTLTYSFVAFSPWGALRFAAKVHGIAQRPEPVSAEKNYTELNRTTPAVFCAKVRACQPTFSLLRTDEGLIH